MFQDKRVTLGLAGGILLLIGIFVAVFFFPGDDPEDTYIELVNNGNCTEVEMLLIELNNNGEMLSQKRLLAGPGESIRSRVNYNNQYRYQIDTSYGGEDEYGYTCFDTFEGAIGSIPAGTTQTINVVSATRPAIVVENIPECPPVKLNLTSPTSPNVDFELVAESGENSETKDLPGGIPINQIFEYTLEAQGDADDACELAESGTFGPTEYDSLYRIHVIDGLTIETIQPNISN